MATKIKLEIESDETIVAAKILLKNKNGQTTIEDVQTEPKKQKSEILEGISEDMKQTW